MAYTIIKSDGTLLTTIADGQINTTSTSLGLPGRNYAGYGQPMDTNLVHILENFADSVPPTNPLQGQLWFDTNTNTLRVCPADGTTVASEWYTLSSTSSTGITTFGSVVVTGNISANNATITNNIDTANVYAINVSASGNANVATANIGNLYTTWISTGSTGTTGNLTGAWTFSAGSTLTVPTFAVTGIATMATTTTSLLTTGGNTTAGTITGAWTLSTGSRIQATYADLAERFESEDVLEPGTVVELGGSKEVRAVRYELSEDVFGVVSNTAAYLMNAGAGTDSTHPPIAVSGRVLVKVLGLVTKGERLVSAGNGLARAAREGEANAFNTIGRSLEDKDSTDVGVVEAIVIIR